MMFKPFLSHGKIFIDLIRADCFAPVAFVGKVMTSAIFISKKTIGNACFTLIEYHDFNAENHTNTIKNKVCSSLIILTEFCNGLNLTAVWLTAHFQTHRPSKKPPKKSRLQNSVLEDTDKEFQRRLQMVNSGILTKEKFISWYFYCDEKTAMEYLPKADTLFGGM